MTPIFSILIPSLPSRIASMGLPLFEKLSRQIQIQKEVEILMLLDNKMRSVGLKRDALVQSARGLYLAFVDDDDDVADDYVPMIVETLRSAPVPPDVLVFNQQTTINDGNPFIVRHGIEYENEGAKKEGERWLDITRKPWHHCVWKTPLAQRHRFPDASYGEDWHWCERVLKEVKEQARIDKVLHYYRFSDKVTEAEAIFPSS